MASFTILTRHALVPPQELHFNEHVNVLQDRHVWVQKRLLAATGLTVLSTSTDTLPRSPVIQHLPLCHLKLDISDIAVEQMESYLLDISYCLTLESLTIRDIDFVLELGPQNLPSMRFHTMPRLKHVTLSDCLLIQALSLPANCLLFLDHCDEDSPWHKHCPDFHSYATALRVTADGVVWPLGYQGFSALEFLECRIEDLVNQDLADLQHIHHVRVASHDQTAAPGRCELMLYLTSGSWQSLEVLFFGELDLTISDVDSFVRDTRSFTLSSEKTRTADEVFQEVLSACERHGKACHVIDHEASWGSIELTYVTLSTSKEVAEKFPIIYDDNHEQGHGVGLWGERTLCHWQGFWPSDPCAPVKRT